MAIGIRRHSRNSQRKKFHLREASTIAFSYEGCPAEVLGVSRGMPDIDSV
jgi:hypothetical protein